MYLILRIHFIDFERIPRDPVIQDNRQIKEGIISKGRSRIQGMISKMHSVNRPFLLLLLPLVIASLMACSRSGSATTQTGSLETPPVSTMTASSVPTEPVMSLVLYHPGSIAPSATVEVMERELSENAVAVGMEVIIADDMGGVELSSGDMIAALMSSPDELEALSSNFPMAHIIGFAEAPISAPNLSVIHFDPGLYDKMGFIGGYISAMQSPEWRAGFLVTPDSGSSVEVTAFINGFTYFCGLCRQVNPPYYDYPVVNSVEPDNSGSIQDALASFSQQRVRTVYLPSSMRDAAFGGVNIPTGLLFVAADSGMEDLTGWMVGVTPDYQAAAERAFSNVEQGGVGTTIPLSVQLAAPNFSNISQGRVEHIEQVLEGVNSGFIALQRE
jgi:hypothetical protein